MINFSFLHEKKTVAVTAYYMYDFILFIYTKYSNL
jgi:hypothetical protein